MGADAHSVRSADAIIVEQSGIPKDQIMPLIDSLTHGFSRYSANLKVIVEELDTPSIDLESDGVIPGEFARERLTKKFLFGLPQYAIVVANWYSANRIPHFAVRLEPGTHRSKIWSRAVNSNADRRMCGVYWDAQDVLQIYGYSLDALINDNVELARQR